MNIIDKKLSEITPYDNNPRFNDEAVEPVANSIKEFGFKVPLVIDKDGIIVAGHTRYKAAQKLGLKTVPCLIADDLTPEQIKAFRIAENKTGELASWDYTQLMEELSGIGLDMDGYGFQYFSFNGQEDYDYDNFETYNEEPEPVEQTINKELNTPKSGQSYRMLIVYTNDQLQDLLNLLKLPDITKHTYRIEELYELEI